MKTYAFVHLEFGSLYQQQSVDMLSYRARQFGADIRSPYDARNAREHIRKSWHFISDKIAEKLILHRQRS